MSSKIRGHVLQLSTTALERVPVDRLSSERRSWLMSRVRSKNTSPEMTVRRIVFGMGYRYRLHDKRLPGSPDMVFAGRRKVIFVNGCFWHGHNGCRYGRLPKSRQEFWESKIEKNRCRDKENVAKLNDSGWNTLVVWQCELKNTDLLVRKLYEFLEN